MDRAAKEAMLGELKEAFAERRLDRHRRLPRHHRPDRHRDARRLPQGGLPLPRLKNTLVKIAVKGTKMEPISKLMTAPPR